MDLFEKCLHEAIRHAKNGSPDYFVTLEAIGEPAKWLQFKWDCINLAYPRESDPNDWLRQHADSVPQYVEVEAWSPNEFVTFSHGAEPVKGLAEFTDLYARDVLALECRAEGFRIDRSE